jgi:hypothetical protein
VIPPGAMSAPADASEMNHAPPLPPGWVPGSSPSGSGGALSRLAEAPPFPPQWPDGIDRPPGARYVAAAKCWRVCRGNTSICSSSDPYHLAEMYAAFEAGDADHEPPWPATLERPTDLDWLNGVWRVRRKKKTLAFSRTPEDLLAQLKASGAPITVAPKIIRPRGRPPSPPSFKVVGHVPAFSGIEVHFRRAPTPTLAPSELCARLGIKTSDLQNAKLPHVGGRYGWIATCRFLREQHALGRAPTWYDPD